MKHQQCKDGVIKTKELLFISTFICFIFINCDQPVLASENDSQVPLSNSYAKFPSAFDTLAFVDALKQSDFSQWRSLEEVAKRTSSGSCMGALNTSMLTALYLLGLLNLCAASPASCCIPAVHNTRNKRSSSQNISPSVLAESIGNESLPLDVLNNIPTVPGTNGQRIPIHISAVEQVKRLWDSNPRLFSSIQCSSTTNSVRSSFISLSGVASGIILAYSLAQLGQCRTNQAVNTVDDNIWLFPIPRQDDTDDIKDGDDDEYDGITDLAIRSLPGNIPVTGSDDPPDGCFRTEVRMENGNCAQVLSSEGCPYMHWVVLDRKTRKGKCVPQLCSEDKIFVEKNQLCHSPYDDDLCPKGQRLFVTAWGEAVCDCPDGEYIGNDGECHGLYEKSFCEEGEVLQFDKNSKSLICEDDLCYERNRLLDSNEPPFVMHTSGKCYQFASRGPCKNDESFGFDIETLSPSCISLEEAGRSRPLRSYTFSSMAVTGNDKQHPQHYEVSYVILNETTWELLMQTVNTDDENRTKRSASESSETVITFIDTRDFPEDMDQLEPALYDLPLHQKKLEDKIKKSSAETAVVSEDVGVVKQHKHRISRRNNLTASKKNLDLKTKNTTTPIKKNDNLNNKIQGFKAVAKHFTVKTSSYKQSEMKSLASKISKRKNMNKQRDESTLKEISQNEKKAKRKLNVRRRLIQATGGPPQNSAKLLLAIAKQKSRQKKIYNIHRKKNLIKVHQKSVSQRPSKSKKIGKDLRRGKRKKKRRRKRRRNKDKKGHKARKHRTEKANDKHKSTKKYTNKPKRPRYPNIERSLITLKNRTILNPVASNINNSVHETTSNNFSISKSTYNSVAISKDEKRLAKNKFQMHKQSMLPPKAKTETRYKFLAKAHPLDTKAYKLETSFSSQSSTKLEKIMPSIKNEIPILNTKQLESNSIQSSLPDYLKNRGRRQAGKALEQNPGIINAPLLNQCRPGARRDYNGHCRPKVIPDSASKSNSDYNEPSQPRLKCSGVREECVFNN